MKMFIADFLQEQNGQSMVEYSLLLAFLTLASAAFFLDSGESIYGIWSITNVNLSTAHRCVS